MRSPHRGHSRPRPGRLAGALLTILLLAGACGRGAEQGGGAGGAWPHGRTFLSTAIRDGGKDLPVAGGAQVELTFDEDGRVGARATCNYLSGTGRLEDGQLVVTDLATTDMACAQDRMNLDSWLASLLMARPRWTLQGDELTLRTATAEIELTDARVADPDKPVLGTHWRLDTLIAGDVASSMPAGVEAYVEFAADATMKGSSGCGNFSGRAQLSGAAIEFGPVEGLQRTCPEASAVVAALKATMNGRVTVDVQRSRLTLVATDGSGLGFTT